MAKSARNRMTVAQAKRLLGVRSNAALATALGVTRQNITYWSRTGLPRWWGAEVRARSK